MVTNVTNRIDGPLHTEPPTSNAAKSQQDEIADILRHTATVLHRDELVAEWVEIERQAGQIDHPPAGGVQQNDKGISKAADVLNIPGKTPEGRRKFVERALRVASICAPAKAAAVAAGLDNNRMELLNVAKAKTPEAQIDKVGEIVETREAQKTAKKARGDDPFAALMAKWQVTPPAAQERFRAFLNADGALVDLNCTAQGELAAIMPIADGNVSAHQKNGGAEL